MPRMNENFVRVTFFLYVTIVNDLTMNATFLYGQLLSAISYHHH